MSHINYILFSFHYHLFLSLFWTDNIIKHIPYVTIMHSFIVGKWKGEMRWKMGKYREGDATRRLGNHKLSHSVIQHITMLLHCSIPLMLMLLLLLSFPWFNLFCMYYIELPKTSYFSWQSLYTTFMLISHSVWVIWGHFRSAFETNSSREIEEDD